MVDAPAFPIGFSLKTRGGGGAVYLERPPVKVIL